MNAICKRIIPIIAALFLQSCVLYAVYGVFRTIEDINNTLTLVNTAMNRIQTVLKEGSDLKRAAEDGRLISTLAEKIPAMIQREVEKAVADKIHLLSGDLKTSALEFTRHALAENLTGAYGAYNGMADTYNRFSDLMTDLAKTTTPVGK